MLMALFYNGIHEPHVLETMYSLRLKSYGICYNKNGGYNFVNNLIIRKPFT